MNILGILWCTYQPWYTCTESKHTHIMHVTNTVIKTLHHIARTLTFNCVSWSLSSPIAWRINVYLQQWACFCSWCLFNSLRLIPVGAGGGRVLQGPTHARTHTHTHTHTHTLPGLGFVCLTKCVCSSLQMDTKPAGPSRIHHPLVYWLTGVLHDALVALEQRVRIWQIWQVFIQET